MDEAERCHRLAFFSGGEVLDVGTPDEITSRRNLHVIELETSRAHEAVAALRHEPGVDDVARYGQLLRIAIRGSSDPVGLVRSRLDACSISVDLLREARVTVEDAFVAMVRPVWADLERTT
jgi:ABC-2 type transport system ATP-binding protein